MEKIKKALEIAGRNRFQDALQADALADDEPSPIPAPAPRSRITPPATADVPVEFTQTRVIPVPRASLESKRILNYPSDSPATRSFDVLASQVVKKLRDKGWNSIAVVSPGPGEGKSLTAINLGIALSRSTERTALVVDMDFRRPSIGQYLSLSPKYGLEDILLGKKAVAEVLISPGIERFSILPIARADAAGAQFIDSSACTSLAAELGKRYVNRTVIFDLPPLLAYGDASVFLHHVDAALLVAMEGITKLENLKDALKVLEGYELLGTVFNRSSEQRPGY